MNPLRDQGASLTSDFEKKAFQKKEALSRLLSEMPSLLMAFSGGVDSAFLLAVAREVLGDRVTAATADSIVFPRREREEADTFAKSIGVSHVIFKMDATLIPEFAANGADRCYFCKKALSAALTDMARERGISAVAFAANTDDLKDYRPGEAAAKEMGILSPLVSAGLSKEEIRFLSREMGLSTWDKPAMACLASRIPYGVPITRKALITIEAAEAYLFGMGIRQLRVRHHGNMARIEVGEKDFPRFLEEKVREGVTARFRELGFSHIALDLEGFVSGSMNRSLTKTSPKAESRP